MLLQLQAERVRSEGREQRHEREMGQEVDVVVGQEQLRMKEDVCCTY